MSTRNTIIYRQVGDYLIPNLELPAEEKEVKIGVWGMRRKNHLIQHNHMLFYAMLADCTLWKHLAEIDKQVEEMFSQLINKVAKAESVTEKLKATDRMAWVCAMNNIRQRATEIVNNEFIFK